MPKKRKEYPLIPLFRRFITEVKKGKHLQTNGKKIKSSSAMNYSYLEILLMKFGTASGKTIRIKALDGANKKEFEEEQLYWKHFYLDFTNFLYDDMRHFDNHVGRMIKLLRSFFNYLQNEKGMNIGQFHRKFYSPSEDVEIVVLAPERLNYLITCKILEDQLEPSLKKVKDVFVFGCSVALRYGDLMALTRANLEVINNRVYLKTRSKKTQTFTRVKLPAYAVNVINKYMDSGSGRLLPFFNKVAMNKKLKELMEIYGFTEPYEKYRQRRGIAEKQYKNEELKTPFRFCDLVTTHTMRRSAITNLLSEGLSEHLVRQISGHAANSKEFFRYVAFAQSFMDDEIDRVHNNLSRKVLEFA